MCCIMRLKERRRNFAGVCVCGKGRSLSTCRACAANPATEHRRKCHLPLLPSPLSPSRKLAQEQRKKRRTSPHLLLNPFLPASSAPLLAACSFPPPHHNHFGLPTSSIVLLTCRHLLFQQQAPGKISPASPPRNKFLFRVAAASQGSRAASSSFPKFAQDPRELSPLRQLIIFCSEEN